MTAVMDAQIIEIVNKYDFNLIEGFIFIIL